MSEPIAHVPCWSARVTELVIFASRELRLAAFMNPAYKDMFVLAAVDNVLRRVLFVGSATTAVLEVLCCHGDALGVDRVPYAVTGSGTQLFRLDRDQRGRCLFGVCFHVVDHNTTEAHIPHFFSFEPHALFIGKKCVRHYATFTQAMNKLQQDMPWMQEKDRSMRAVTSDSEMFPGSKNVLTLSYNRSGDSKMFMMLGFSRTMFSRAIPSSSSFVDSLPGTVSLMSVAVLPGQEPIPEIFKSAARPLGDGSVVVRVVKMTVKTPGAVNTAGGKPAGEKRRRHRGPRLSHSKPAPRSVLVSMPVPPVPPMPPIPAAVMKVSGSESESVDEFLSPVGSDRQEPPSPFPFPCAAAPPVTPATTPVTMLMVQDDEDGNDTDDTCLPEGPLLPHGPESPGMTMMDLSSLPSSPNTDLFFAKDYLYVSPESYAGDLLA